MRDNLHNSRMRLAVAVGMAAVGFVVNIGLQAYAQQAQRAKAQAQEEVFTRPKPTRPIRPEIPSADRYRQDKIFLEYADSLFRTDNPRDTVDCQIVKGSVKFRQAGMWMYCDSAYYYPGINSLDAFGNVRMEQGDTLFVYADKLFYEGNERMARLKNGPSCPKVRLINRDVTLTTDSLDYSIAMELGWYSRWGVIDDKVNTLTSLYGEYSPGTKNADFFTDVELVNNRDGYTLLTDTLHYSTLTHIARIESRTQIQGKNDTIFTTRGLYDSDAGNAELLTRSMIVHRDSNNNVTTLEGDSIIYDKPTRITRAYMFRDPDKRALPMVITDTARNTTLIGGFGLYNDSTREALATMYPLLMEYSQGDTLFLRADTIKTYIVTEMVKASRRATKSGFPEYMGRITIQPVDGRMVIDEEFFSPVPPLQSAPLTLLEKVTGVKHREKKIVPENDGFLLAETADTIAVAGDSVSSARGDTLTIEPVDTFPLVQKEFHVALAYHRGRFFKQDLQGIADSLVFQERDSMLYMFRKPIVWSGERQVTGNRIDVHFNDSTADWALLPESGMLSELVDEDFYNQLGGKRLLATFENQTVKSIDVSGNVEIIFLPQENDSTFNRLVQAESSYLKGEMENNQIKHLKLWPEVSGNVTPIFLVKKQQKYLQRFRWWESLRPVRQREGDRWRWEDNLGEVSEELDAYFTSPSDFGEPKSFPASRPLPTYPPVSLPEVEKNETEMEREEESIEQQTEVIEQSEETMQTEEAAENEVTEEENNNHQQ